MKRSLECFRLQDEVNLRTKFAWQLFLEMSRVKSISFHMDIGTEQQTPRIQNYMITLYPQYRSIKKTSYFKMYHIDPLSPPLGLALAQHIQEHHSRRPCRQKVHQFENGRSGLVIPPTVMFSWSYQLSLSQSPDARVNIRKIFATDNNEIRIKI